MQGIKANFDVQIKFPDRDVTEENQVDINGGGENGEGDQPQQVYQCDIIRITGRQENCEKARQALLDSMPVTEEINVAFNLHRSIIGQKGYYVRDLMNKYDVRIDLSPPDQHLDIIKITGTPANIADAKLAIAQRVEELEQDRNDRELRSFELKMEIDPEWHPKIIGRKGAVINKIRADHDVQISFPRKEDEVDNIITIQGYEASARAAEVEIMKIINEQKSLYREVITVDYRVHSRIIGQRGRNIRKIMDDYKVEIQFPRETDREENRNSVTIIGPEEAVLNAKDHILNLEEEYLQDVVDTVRLPTNDFSTVFENVLSKSNSQQKKEGFIVQGAPWEKKNNKKAPNTASHEDFPNFGIAPAPIETPISSAWGPRR